MEANCAKEKKRFMKCEKYEFADEIFLESSESI